MYQILNYSFMQNALIAVIIISPILGILGTMVVQKQMSFFSDALGHSALTGIAVGAILGMTNANISMIVFGVIFALLLNHIRFRTKIATDTIISVCASVSLAIGLAILSRGGNFAQYSSFLVGDILSIRQSELPILGICAVLVIAYWILSVNALNATTIHPTLAKSFNIPTRLSENLFAVILAILVMISIRWIGVLLINALLILPAAASRNLAGNMREYHLYTILISLFCGLLGLFMSYSCNIATGPMIVIYAGIIYFATYMKCRH